MEQKQTSRASFGGSIGFVLAAAGSAVGLGNIWRFPYLAAKDGGGFFLLVYLVLAITFGFTLLTTEVAIGRFSKQSPRTAYSKVKKGWGGLGILSTIVPIMIFPYYCVIGGWVLKFFIAFLTGHNLEAAEDGYFTGFITDQYEPIIMLFVFILICAVIIFMGVTSGIESVSKIVMPALLLIIIGIAIYSLTLKRTDADGTRTGLEGLKMLVVPSFEGMTLKKFCITIIDAMGQLFYSLSVAMGIMITYGSYVKDDNNLVKSINQIEIFDTVVAFLAGVMILPSIYVFSGPEGMSAGASLMFVALPKIFAQMGFFGRYFGALFFLMVLFAAITSAMSILEAIVSVFIDRFGMSRRRSTVLVAFFCFLIAVVVCLGYNKLYFEAILPNTEPGHNAQILDIMDYISNNVLMPIVSIATCILIGWVVKPEFVIKEVTKNGEKFGRKGLYIVMVKFVVPVLLLILLLISFGIIKF